MSPRRAQRSEAGPRPVPALRFRLFGFPVQADASFLLISAMIGFGLPAARLGTWVVVSFLAVLAHELGHAFAARSLGAQARIELAGLGGLTHWQADRALSKPARAFVTAAGPATGLLLGIPVMLAGSALGWESWTAGGFALDAAAWATIGWSVLNLVPVLPLDGGALLELALPGDPVARKLNAARVGTAVGGLGAVLSWRADLQFTALFAVMLAAQNYALVKQLSGAAAESPPAEGAPAHGRAPSAPARQPVLDRLREAGDLIAAGDHERALALVAPLAGDTLLPADWRVTAALMTGLSLVALGRPDQAVAASRSARGCWEGLAGYARAAGGDPEGGLVAAHRAFAAKGSQEAAAWVLEASIVARRFDEAADFVDTEDASLVPAFTAWRLMAAAFAAGAHEATGRIGDAVAACGRAEAPHAAYNAACGWSRAGDPERAIRSLVQAVKRGWNDIAQIDTDPDLATARSGRDWAAFRTGAGTSA